MSRVAYAHDRREPQTVWTLNQIQGDVPYLLGHFSSEPRAIEQAARVVAHDLGQQRSAVLPKWTLLTDGTRELVVRRDGRTFHFRLNAWLLDCEVV